MDDEFDEEIIGSCTTNTTKDSVYVQVVEAKCLWSYAQEEALIALSEQRGDKQWQLIADPERRAQRIAARYADLYFASAEKSGGKVQFYWPALAAFVVKDIVEAFRYARENVLAGGWKNALRTSTPSQLGSAIFTSVSPYEHAARVYAALAKGNLWLFMDVYPWYWFFLEYGINRKGEINAALLNDHVTKRDASTFQRQSQQATIGLPFGAQWMSRQKDRQQSDPVYQAATQYFDAQPVWNGAEGGYTSNAGAVYQANAYVKRSINNEPLIYRMPVAHYWRSFTEPYYVLDETHRELLRIASDGAATARLNNIATFHVKPDVQSAYSTLIDEKSQKGNALWSTKLKELIFIAKHEQLDILQPVIYDDQKLADTMNVNHRLARSTGGWLSPTYAVKFTAAPTTDDPDLIVEFDQPTGIGDRILGAITGGKSLPNPDDRMVYVGRIATTFHKLMQKRTDYMERELEKIKGWLHA